VRGARQFAYFLSKCLLFPSASGTLDAVVFGFTRCFSESSKPGFCFMARFTAHKMPMVSLLLTVFLVCTNSAHSKNLALQTGDAHGPVVALAALPVQAQQTYALILQGGPFPFDKDGSVFGNREHRLPVQARGYYREYTVKTPGVKSRGARRIACGGVPRSPEACYYSDDHYASFRRIGP
jgi:ribonuclease T1